MTHRMESSLTRKLGIFSVTLVALALVMNSVPFLLNPSYAACQLEADVNLLSISRNNMILYWEERPCDPETSVKYQTSSNKGETWNDVQILISSAELGSVEDFDGIKEAGRKGRLVASFAVIELGALKLKVMTSDNYGQDWSGPDLVWNISDDIPSARFLGCPVLTGQFHQESKVFTLFTTIVETTIEGDKAYIYLVNSQDGGKSWDAPLRLGEVPPSDLCD